MAWIFDPYNKARFEGRVAQMNAPEMKNIVESVENRINTYIFGDAEELPLEGHYERIGGGENWSLVKETGPASRMSMYHDGINAFVSLVAKKDSSMVYTIGRKSVWIPFDLPKLYEKLNLAEGDSIEKTNFWGGSDTIGGSPRKTGSKLTPEDIQKIINSN